MGSSAQRPPDNPPSCLSLFKKVGTGKPHRVLNHETYIPAFRYSPQAQPRLSRAHEHQGWSPRHRRASLQGPRRSVGVEPVVAPNASPAPVAPDVPKILAGATFPRAARLLQPDDFVRALKTRAQRGRFLWVYRRSAEPTASGSQAARPRLGMMIGKKNAKLSVLRNAIKRRIREQFRLRQSVLPPSQYVVRLSLPVTTKDVPAIIAEWTGALERDIAKLARTEPMQSTPSATPSVTA